MNTCTKSKCKKWVPIVIWLAVLLSGHVAMGIWWILFDDKVFVERGFTYFRAATYGDAISLPLLGLCFSAFFARIAPLLKENKRKKLRTLWVILFVIMALVGAVWQLSWLVNPDTLTNWTLVDKVPAGKWLLKEFTIEGYYHAAFFVFAMGFLGSLFLLFLYTNATLDVWTIINDNVFRRWFLLGVSFAGCFYMEFHFADDLESHVYTSEYGIVLSRVFLGYSLILIASIIMPSLLKKRHGSVMDVVPLAAGNILAVGLSSVVLLEISHRVTLLCCAVVSIGYAFVLNRVKRKEYNDGSTRIAVLDKLFVLLLVVGVMFSILTACLEYANSWYNILWWIMLVGWPVVAAVWRCWLYREKE